MEVGWSSQTSQQGTQPLFDVAGDRLHPVVNSGRRQLIGTLKLTGDTGKLSMNAEVWDRANMRRPARVESAL